MDVSIDSAAMDKEVKRTLGAIQGAMKKSPRTSIIMLADRTMRTMKTHTPKAPLKRKIIDNPKFARFAGTRRRRGQRRPAKFLIEKFNGDGEVTHIATNKKSDRRARIRLRGLAQFTWSAAIANLKRWDSQVGRGLGGGKAERLARKFVRVSLDGSGRLTTLRIKNRNRYVMEIMKISPDQALRSGMRQIRSRINRNLVKAAERAALRKAA